MRSTKPEPRRQTRKKAEAVESVNRSPDRSPGLSSTTEAPAQVQIEGFLPIYRTHAPEVKEADDAMRRRKQVETQIAAAYKPGRKSARGVAASARTSPRKGGKEEVFSVKQTKGTALVQLENSQFVVELSADDKAKLVRNKAGPDEYAELDYELVQP